MHKKYGRNKAVVLVAILISFCIPFSVRAQSADSTVLSGDFMQYEPGSGDTTDDEMSGNSVSDGNAYMPEGVISMVLPTSFDLMMLLDSDDIGGIIQSQDIMVINKSSFPINMKIKDVWYEIVRESLDAGEQEV